MLQGSKEAHVIVGKLVHWVLAVLCVDGVTPALIRYLSLKFFFLCVLSLLPAKVSVGVLQVLKGFLT